MAKVSYVPYSTVYEDLFTFCGITLPTADFGGQQGWDAAEFSNAAILASDFLNDNLTDDNAAEYEAYFEMLENYDVFYWSTESPIYG